MLWECRAKYNQVWPRHPNCHEAVFTSRSHHQQLECLFDIKWFPKQPQPTPNEPPAFIFAQRDLEDAMHRIVPLPSLFGVSRLFSKIESSLSFCLLLQPTPTEKSFFAMSRLFLVCSHCRSLSHSVSLCPSFVSFAHKFFSARGISQAPSKQATSMKVRNNWVPLLHFDSFIPFHENQ